MESKWFYRDGGKEKGPIDEATLLDLIRAGVIGKDDSVLKDGSSDWRPASSLPGALNSEPPPLTTNAPRTKHAFQFEPARTTTPPPTSEVPALSRSRVSPQDTSPRSETPAVSVSKQVRPPPKPTASSARVTEIRRPSTNARPSTIANVLTGMGVLSLFVIVAAVLVINICTKNTHTTTRIVLLILFSLPSVFFIRMALRANLPRLLTGFLKCTGVLFILLMLFMGTEFILDPTRDVLVAVDAADATKVVVQGRQIFGPDGVSYFIRLEDGSEIAPDGIRRFEGRWVTLDIMRPGSWIVDKNLADAKERQRSNGLINSKDYDLDSIDGSREFGKALLAAAVEAIKSRHLTTGESIEQAANVIRRKYGLSSAMRDEAVIEAGGQVESKVVSPNMQAAPSIPPSLTNKQDEQVELQRPQATGSNPVLRAPPQGAAASPSADKETIQGKLDNITKLQRELQNLDAEISASDRELQDTYTRAQNLRKQMYNANDRTKQSLDRQHADLVTKADQLKSKMEDLRKRKIELIALIEQAKNP